MAQLVRTRSDYPSNVNEYNELDILGRGTFGQVKKMRVNGTDQDVAVKRLSIGEYLKRKFPNEAEDAKNMLIKEVNHEYHTITESMRDPECIRYFPQYYTHFEGDDQDSYYVVTELVDGFNLESNNPMAGNLDETFRFASDILTGLDCIHKRNIVHRDIKPANLMYDRKRNGYVIVDFGLACFNTMGGDEELNCGKLTGTTYFIDPDSVLVKATAQHIDNFAHPDTTGQPYDDIYGLAITILELYKPSLMTDPAFSDYYILKNKIDKLGRLVITGINGRKLDQESYLIAVEAMETYSKQVFQILIDTLNSIERESIGLAKLLRGMLRIKDDQRVPIIQKVDDMYQYNLEEVPKWSASRCIDFLKRIGEYKPSHGQGGGSSMGAVTSRNEYNSAKADYLNLVKMTQSN